MIYESIQPAETNTDVGLEHDLLGRFKWILRWIYACIFGCIHRRTTWPHRGPAGFDCIRCLDCGADLPYSLRQMRIVTSEELLEECHQETRGSGGRIRTRAAVSIQPEGR
jgi:hypothetical protein